MHGPVSTLELLGNQATAEIAGRGFPQSFFREIGEDPQREGLLRTPARFLKAYREMTIGYRQTPAEVVGEGIFETESAGVVAVRDIEFYSLCEHHLLPFWGKATVAYLPKGKILGLSKLPRILDVFARRFQVQERLTKEFAEAVHALIDARAVAVTIEAQHMCMMMRGVKKQQSTTKTEHFVGLKDLDPTEKERLLRQIDQ
jgi:GTP cyclohydrolase I